jgi:hypothetical protein
MATLIWTEPAVADLEEIGQFISKDNPPLGRFEQSHCSKNVKSFKGILPSDLGALRATLI